MNSNKEILRTNPKSGNAEVLPVTRTPSEAIPNAAKERHSIQETTADQRTNSQEVQPQQNRPGLETPDNRNPNIADMHNYNMAGMRPVSPSHERAMMNSTSFGNPVNHYGMKSTTTTIV